MYLTEDHEEIIAMLERKAYNIMAQVAEDTPIKDATTNGAYNLGYNDAVKDFCEELKATVRKEVNVKKNKEEMKEASGNASKYDE